MDGKLLTALVALAACVAPMLLIFWALGKKARRLMMDVLVGWLAETKLRQQSRRRSRAKKNFGRKAVRRGR